MESLNRFTWEIHSKMLKEHIQLLGIMVVRTLMCPGMKDFYWKSDLMERSLKIKLVYIFLRINKNDASY